MKQIALSLFVIVSSGAYVWNQAGTDPAGDMNDTAGSASSAEDNAMQPPGRAPAALPVVVTPALPSPTFERQSVRIEPTAATTVVNETWTPAEFAASDAAASITVRPAAYVPIPKPRPGHRQAPARVIKVGMKSSVNATPKPAAHGFADGSYAGPVTDAYYGLIQIQALVRGGHLTALKVLKYPSDRRTSILINRQALPLLRDEAISAQTADVDIISGATLTSRAFIQSLRGALKKASS